VRLANLQDRFGLNVISVSARCGAPRFAAHAIRRWRMATRKKATKKAKKSTR